MNVAVHEFTRLLMNKEDLPASSVDELEQLANRYPYFIAGRLLYLRKLQETNEANLQDELRKAEIWVPNTAWLDQLIFDTGSVNGSGSGVLASANTAVVAPAQTRIENDVITSGDIAVVDAAQTRIATDNVNSGKIAGADLQQTRLEADDVTSGNYAAAVSKPSDEGTELEIIPAATNAEEFYDTTDPAKDPAEVNEEGLNANRPGSDQLTEAHEPIATAEEVNSQTATGFNEFSSTTPAETTVPTAEETLPGTEPVTAVDEPAFDPLTGLVSANEEEGNSFDEMNRYVTPEASGNSIVPQASEQTIATEGSAEGFPRHATEEQKSTGEPITGEWNTASESGSDIKDDAKVYEGDPEADETDGDELPPTEDGTEFRIAPFREETMTPGQELSFEPFHTVDYFASQGIQAKEEEKPVDRFSQQLKSFTQWLKAIKKVPAGGGLQEEKKIEEMAEHSVKGREVVTEAMAEVWIKQGNPEKAKLVYQKLSLLDPAKSAYFAAKIEQLKQF